MATLSYPYPLQTIPFYLILKPASLNIIATPSMASAFISIDKPFYFAGDTVQGQVFLNLFENMIANEVTIKFKGWQSVRWFEERIVPEHERPNIAANLIFNAMIKIRMDSSDSEDHPGDDESSKYRYVQDGSFLKEIIKYSGEKQLARFENVLYNFEGSFIPAGQYAFPFSFKTGENYPASYMDKSFQNNRRGRIKYELQAFVRGFNSRLRLIKTRQEIVVRETAVIKNDHQIMEAHVTSCCCIDQGTTRIECYFEKNAYTPGEDARMYCKCDNTQGKSEVRSVDVSLINEITYTASDGYKKVFREILFKKSFQGLGVGEKGEREQTVKILNSQTTTGPSDIKPTARGTRLHSVYYLLVDANLAAACTCCSNLPIVKQPILIFPFIPVDYNFKAPLNWAPTIMPMRVLTVSLGGLGVAVGGIGMNVQMNVPPPPNVQMQMNMNVPPPSVNMQMNVHAPPPQNVNVQMNTSPNMKMNITGPSMHVSGTTMTSSNVNMGMNTNMYAPGMNVQVNGGMGSPYYSTHHQQVHMSPTKTNVNMNAGMTMEMQGMGMNVRM